MKPISDTGDKSFIYFFRSTWS